MSAPLLEKTIKHLFNVITNDPQKFYLLGHGTESHRLLTEAYAQLSGIEIEVVHDIQPDPKKWQSFLKKQERIDHFLEWDEAPEPEVIEIDSRFVSCECVADCDEPDAFRSYLAGAR